ncbi:MAG: hypothetical protein JWM34_3001 [Ilumatobacteraceae bacterium]|nr:hypothetical protein [Ilumatobacteraceae bacterium]
MTDPQHRIATYGSLAPGEPNHKELDGLRGRWVDGHVRGRLRDAGWGAAIGFPGLVLDDDGVEVPVHVFESEDLPDHWTRLDEFEGEGYRRVSAVVHTELGNVEACIYVLAT